MEKVRLVIWDLDETFWRGTVSEGGIEYLRDSHDIVVELARRGIVSSICSRNNHAEIEQILRQHGIWEYFVFPSIDWSAKGPRLRAIVEAAQLRPPTVMFIDDNPMNLAEAQHFVDGVQVADPSIITGMLENPLFQGKDDSSLTRLAQYKLLERRALDLNKAEDPRVFLRTSNIRVIIEHDVEPHLDRAIELINRTNQLNFTKRRLPEDLEAARLELRRLVDRYDIQAGLIRVVDRYGDYGYCGVYVHSSTVHAPPELIHYCFSCRTLGMQVETWVYQRLGRPLIKIEGEVLTNIQDPEAMVDWIRLEADPASHSATAAQKTPKLSRVFMRGGCELVAVYHYFEVLTDNIVGEFAFNRGAVPFRIDHSLVLRQALDGLSEARLEAARSLGYAPSDFETALLKGNGEPEVWILSFWADFSFPVFRHRQLDFRVPFQAYHLVGEFDLTRVNLDTLTPEVKSHWVGSAIVEIQRSYVFEGLSDTTLFRQSVTEIISRLPSNAHAFILGPSEKRPTPDGGLQDEAVKIEHNRQLREIVGTSPNITLLTMDNYVRDMSERNSDPNHFARQVYFRLFEDVRRRIDELALAKEMPVESQF